MSVEPQVRVATSRPAVVYERVVEKGARKGGGGKTGRLGAGELWGVPEGRSGQGTAGARKEKVRGRTVRLVEGEKGRRVDECPPEKGGEGRGGRVREQERGGPEQEREKVGERERGGEVSGDAEVISGLLRDLARGEVG